MVYSLSTRVSQKLYFETPTVNLYLEFRSKLHVYYGWSSVFSSLNTGTISSPTLAKSPLLHFSDPTTHKLMFPLVNNSENHCEKLCKNFRPYSCFRGSVLPV